jgi:tRNA (guanine-N7-)-methyltransferase
VTTRPPHRDQEPDGRRTPVEEPRDLRSYGRRRGRKSSPRQQDLEETILPRLRLPLQAPPPVQLTSLGGANCRQVWLEIGFGGGEHLVWQAQRNPNTLAIGCEPFMDGVVKVLDAIERENLTNIRLHPDDARAVLRWLTPGSIDRAFILFPDPWPKLRHRKRRLVNSETSEDLARVMKPGAELRLGTDIGDYATQMLDVLQASDAFDWQASRPVDWRERPADWPPTRYEQKALREGRRCTYLRFTRRA